MKKNLSEELWINYHGLFQSPMSWAQVNRELVLALDRLGLKTTVLAYRGFCYQPDFPLPPRISALRALPLSQQWDLAFEYPLNYRRLKAKRKAGLMVYETTELPPHWVAEINRHLDVLIVPSRFCRETAIDSGVTADRVEVVPYGHAPDTFRHVHGLPLPVPSFAEKRFVFLCIAMPHLRKGIRELVQAFTEEFSPEEPVELVVKVPYLPRADGKRRPWELAPEDLGLKPGASPGRGAHPPVHFMHRLDPPDQMPLWFAACDAYVQPSYGEGFGLSILEAKAMGRPVLATGWGGHMDFCDATDTYLLDYDLVPAGRAQYDHQSPHARCAKPRVASLRREMRRVFADPREGLRRTTRSRERSGALTWDAAAGELLAVLRERT